MEKRGSAELLNVEQNNSKNASSDSLNSDSKSSSLNSKMGQESVRLSVCLIEVRLTCTLYEHIFMDQTANKLLL